ncbi:hypothetical protein HG531_001592 [Fusarium graminearum]|nr:hypothetical protein HG531_001592 [Fusarium graminearum]
MSLVLRNPTRWHTLHMRLPFDAPDHPLKLLRLIYCPKIINVLVSADSDHPSTLTVEYSLPVDTNGVLGIFSGLILELAAAAGVRLLIVFDRVRLIFLFVETCERCSCSELAPSHTSSNPRLCLNLLAAFQLDLFHFICTKSNSVGTKLFQNSFLLSFLVGQLRFDLSLSSRSVCASTEMSRENLIGKYSVFLPLASGKVGASTPDAVSHVLFGPKLVHLRCVGIPDRPESPRVVHLLTVR